MSHKNKSGCVVQGEGFEKAGSILHMIDWFGRGGEIGKIFTNDIENELRSQDEGSGLLSAEFLKTTEIESKFLKQAGEQPESFFLRWQKKDYPAETCWAT